MKYIKLDIKIQSSGISENFIFYHFLYFVSPMLHIINSSKYCKNCYFANKSKICLSIYVLL